MAVTSTTRKITYLGNDVATVFAFAYKVFTAADMYVLREDSSGNIAILVLGTDYSVALNANQDVTPGGSVTLLAGPLASGFRMTLTSDIAELQQVVLTNLGGFFPDVLNGVFDRLTILIQQLQIGVDQSLKFSLTDDLTSTSLPSAPQRAGKFLYFDTAGNVSLVEASPSGAAVFAGVPSGTINGANKTFALPTIGTLVQFFWNGVLQNPLAGDYSISGSNIVMTNAPVSGDSLYALIFG